MGTRTPSRAAGLRFMLQPSNGQATVIQACGFPPLPSHQPKANETPATEMMRASMTTEPTAVCRRSRLELAELAHHCRQPRAPGAS